MFGAPLDSEPVTAAAAIAGSLVGAVGFIVGTLISTRHQDRRDMLGRIVARRETRLSSSDPFFNRQNRFSKIS